MRIPEVVRAEKAIKDIRFVARTNLTVPQRSFDKAIWALELQVPKKPRRISIPVRTGDCPNCLNVCVRFWEWCPNGGQRLDWVGDIPAENVGWGLRNRKKMSCT